MMDSIGAENWRASGHQNESNCLTFFGARSRMRWIPRLERNRAVGYSSKFRGCWMKRGSFLIIIPRHQNWFPLAYNSLRCSSMMWEGTRGVNETELCNDDLDHLNPCSESCLLTHSTQVCVCALVCREGHKFLRIRPLTFSLVSCFNPLTSLMIFSTVSKVSLKTLLRCYLSSPFRYVQSQSWMDCMEDWPSNLNWTGIDALEDSHR